MSAHNLSKALAFLEQDRQFHVIELRLRRLIERLSGVRLGRRQLRKAFKVNIHDHIDCFPEYGTLLKFWDEVYGFDFANVKFPDGVRAYWRAMNFDPSSVAFPPEIVSAWRGQHLSPALAERARSTALADSREKAASDYGKFLVNYAGGSVFQYVQAIVVHILPVMLKADAIKLIVQERLANAKKQGERMLELRGAPQLHTWGELSIEDALLAYIEGIKEALIPVSITICAQRHQDPSIAWELAKLGGKYRNNGVSTFDLGGDEASNAGVLTWWIKPAVLALLFGLQLTIHLWETNDPTDEDIAALNGFDHIFPLVKERLAIAGVAVEDVLISSAMESQVARIIDDVIAEVMSGSVDMNIEGKHVIERGGHMIRGFRQGSRVAEVCFSSNVVTGQVQSFAEHPGHELWRRGTAITIATDGTTLIGIEGLFDEYVRLSQHGWGAADLLLSNLYGIGASSFTLEQKSALVRECLDSYESIADELD